uniref:Uncharacterized protein n=1 Tax=Candidatus Kentrum sp. SD TaxID=2126332 RepID=A0A450Y6Z4_9GAMM|nr:MAG: hypothetical protein BECKSD772F_GA0070984_101333 [Candidatus Kentron sp. SD]VFK42348.1 MAG: hypothetical protein BECKSD772E_GA0070983_101629 [Candidatus Kentron sp. SD]VFK79447.1 MAG: hypothetical protein BECKSD772D_GA0070982_105013 [Candidatus Kentron sp. SD]
MNIDTIIEGSCRAQRQAIIDDTARFVEKHAQTLNLGPDVLAGLQQGLADVKRLVRQIVFWAERLLELSEGRKSWGTGACTGIHSLSVLARSANIFDSTPPSITSASRPPASAGRGDAGHRPPGPGYWLSMANAYPTNA